MKKCYQILSAIVLFLALATQVSAQNNLSAGDLAIASYQSDFDPTNPVVGDDDIPEFEDRFSLIVTKPGGIAAGTVIFFTTRGWNGPAGTWHDEDFTPFTFGLGRRAVVQWTVPAGGIAQGTEIFFINTYHDEVAVGSEYYSWAAYANQAGTVLINNLTNVTPIVPGANTTDGMSFAVSGDKLLVYQTGPPAGPNAGPNNSTIRFITALLANVNGTTVVAGTTAYATWDAVPGAMASNESSIPPGLVNGQTCFLMSPSSMPNVSNGTTEPDNGKFSACALASAGVCTALQMSTIIYATNPAGTPTTPNWTYSNSVFPVNTSSSLCTYNILATNTITLTSAAGTNNQTRCINTAITNITYSTTGATGATFSGLPAGVTGNWAANVVTISGSPTTTVGSPFNYTVTLTGGCGTVTATGAITVTPNNTITLTSAAGTNAQTKCINTAITNITYSTTGATGATFSGLPAGVTGNWAANVVTISGSPTTTVGSPFNYTVTLTGGCGTVTATGTITVTGVNTITLSSAAGTDAQSVTVNTPIINITYNTTNATGATFSGLPAGVTGTWAANVVTISGTPTTAVGSPFSYTVTLTGGCGTVTATGTITVTTCSVINQTVAASPTSVCSGNASTITVGASQPGVNYTLRLDPSNTVVAGPTASNGPAINFSTGPLVAATTYNVLAETDKYSVYLNGGESGFAIPQNAALDVTDNFTIEGWIKPDGDPDFGRLFNKDGCYALGISNNQTDLTFTRHGSGDFSRPFTFVSGTWYHIACTYVGGTVELFVNGVSIGTVTGVPSIVTNTVGGHIGSDASGNFNQFKGNLDNVRIWNTVRSQAQIAANQNAFLTSTGNPSLVASWWIIEGTGAAKDYSANAINSTGLVGTWQADAPGAAPCSIVLSTKPTVTIAPNNSITLTSAAGTNAQTVCINTPITNITYSTTGATGATFSGLPAGVTGNWAANVVTISGSPTTTVGSPFSYTVTLTGGGTCGTLTATGTITVTPNNTITLTSAAGTNNQTRCINTAITNITYSTTGATGATFSGLPAGVTGNWAANVVTISGSPTTNVGSPFNYTVTLTGGCSVVTATGTITVIPNNTITLTSAAGTNVQTVCINTAITNITYSTTSATGATFSGLPAGVTGNWAANVVTISGAPSTTVASPYNYTVTLTGGCGPTTTATGTITVTPAPTISCPGNINVNAATNSCSAVVSYTASGTPGSASLSYIFTGATTGSGSGSGSGSTFNVGVTTVALTATGCGTATCSFTVTVNDVTPPTITCPAQIVVCGSQVVNYPLPTVTDNCTIATPLNLTQSSSTSIAASNSVSCNNGAGHTANGYWRVYDLAALGVTGPYTVNQVVFGVESANTTSGSQPATIKVYTLTGAFTIANLTQVASENITITNQAQTLITVNLTTPPTVAANAKLVLEVFTPDGRPTSSLFYMGSNTAAQTAPNYISAPDCGVNDPLDVSAVGYPNMHSVLNAVGIVGGAIVPVQTAGLPSGSTFPVGTTVNTYTATDAAGNTSSCSFNVIVNPVPTVNAVTNQTVCNGATTAAITFTGAVAGTVYNWTNNTTSIGLAASGTGNIGTFTATNATNAPVTATITVTPSYTNAGTTCTGAPITFTITVNPTPTVNAVGNQTVCNGAPTTTITFTGFAPGTVYNWTNNTTSIGLAASGTGNIASFNGVNGGNAAVTATITVTPTYTNNGTTCTGTSTTFTITVNPTPIVGSVGNQELCNGATTNAVNFNGTVSGEVFNWTNNTPSIGLAASGSGNIAAFTAVNLTNAPVIATITVTPSYTNAGTTCTGAPITFTIKVDPKAQVNAVGNQTVCNGAPTTAVTFTGTTANTVYNWTNNTTSIGLAASGTGNIASFNAINTGTAPVTATITVTPVFTGGSGSCPGDAITFTITVNPTATVTTVANQVICNGANTTAVNFTSPTTGGTIVYNWTNNTTSIGLAASGTGNIASFVATNATAAAITATVIVTPSYTNNTVTCVGTPMTFTITVNPTPTVNQPTNQVVCNGAPTTLVTFTGATTGTVYNWTNSAPSIGIAATGTGNIASFNAINTTNAPVVATIVVTPSYTNGGTTCTGASKTFTITVNPTPTVNTVANQVICNAANTTAVTFSGFVPGTVYSWTNTTTSIGLAASGTGNIASFVATNAGATPVTATIVVTPSYTNAGTTCTGNTTTFTITVNPTPTVNAVSNQVICNNANTTTVTFTGAVTGTVYNWTNNTTSIGLAASGTGNITSFVATNSTNAPVTATIVVTPSYTNGGTTCTGSPKTFTITVNPTPTVNTVADQVVCNTANTTAVTFSGFVPGTVYSWTNTTTSIGLAASGTGNIASFVATNAGATPVTATIVVTPSYTNGGTTCTGNTTTFTITVNPTPTVNTIPSETVCNNSPTTAVVFTGAVAGTVYNWTNNTTSIGLAASGTGNIASFTATNATNAPVTATITVTPSYTNGGTTCTGSSKTYTVTVNPTAITNTVPNQVVCNGATVAAINFSSPATGGTIVYNWTNSNVFIGLAGAGVGSTPTFVANNNTAVPVVATISVTATYTNNGVSCVGPATTFTITVNPAVSVDAIANQTLCNGSGSTPVVFTGTATGTVYNWTNNTTSIGLAASGTGNIPSFTATNAGATPVTATITVTPTYTNGGTTCTGPSKTFTITVNPTPTVNTVANQTVCNNTGTTAITFSGTVAGTVYNWTNNTTSIGLAASGTGNIPSFVGINTTNAAITATITVTPSYTNGGITCTGTSKTFTITVNPTPSVNAVANQVLCNAATTTAVTFTGAVTGTVYNWTNNTTSIGLAASGTGNIAAFTAVNTGTTPVTATITVTPSYTNGTTCTGAPITFTITVNPTTVIATQPTNVTLCAGGNATFTVAATGTALTYQWQVNTGAGFNNIPSATAPTLNVNTVIASMNGYIYHVIVTGTCGTVTSNNVTLTVNTAPVIAVQPVSTPGCVGGSVTFGVTATGTALTYQWELNTGSGFAPIPGATNSTYTQTGITAAMAGYQYHVIINGTCAPPVTSSTATLTVNIPAVISTQPASLTICFGPSTATFSVTATGSALTYQWQVNSGSGFTNIAGATSSTLVVSPPTLLISGYQYRVIVTGPCNTLTSSSATLIVFALPNISFSTLPPRVCLTDTIVTLRALPAGGTWSGRGVTGDKFSAVNAGLGVSNLTYTVTNANGCISTDYYNITVNDCIERHNNIQSGLKVFPVPNNGQFYVKWLTDKYTSCDMQLMDASGRVMKTLHFSGLTYGGIISINARDLASGTYFLRVSNSGDVGMFPIVIIH